MHMYINDIISIGANTFMTICMEKPRKWYTEMLSVFMDCGITIK